MYTLGGGAVAMITGISADGLIIVGYDPTFTGVWWQRISKSGHPVYRAYPAPALPPGHGTLTPYAVSPDGTLLTGMGVLGSIGIGFAYSRTTGAAAMVNPSINGDLGGVTDSGLIAGDDPSEQPATWQFTG